MNKINKIKGSFIVFEGIDGSGTTTHSKLAVNALNKMGLSSYWTCEPSSGAIGKLIREKLISGKQLKMETMALLFAADRMDHVDTEIEPNLSDGKIVVSDRYDLSSIIYQGVTGDGDPLDNMDWIETLNERIITEDMLIILDVPPQIALERRNRRNMKKEFYELDSLQEKLAYYYNEVKNKYPGLNIKVVDGNGSIEEVHKRCMTEINSYLYRR